VVGEGELIESKERPDEGREDEEDVYGCEEVVFQAKLKIGEGEIENEVKSKRQRDRPRERSFKELVKHRAIGNSDDGVQNWPYNSKN